MQSKQQMEAFVISFLETNLPAPYHYHGCEHSLYVMDKAVEIARHENCTEKETELLKAAALWHDAGYVKVYKGHEEESCVLAQRYLPEYGFTPGDINKICGMIMATKVPQLPQNKLEEILADADLEYLGTADAGKKAGLFFLELQHLDPLITITEWNKRQIAFLRQHRYFTRYCRENKEPGKLEYLAGLIKNS